MGIIELHTVTQSNIVQLESRLNALWHEMNATNIAHHVRMELEERLANCEERFKAALSGQASLNELETDLHQCDLGLAKATIEQAQNELPKSEHDSGSFLALENVRKELETGDLSPTRARHEVKRIMRPHT